jgi:iron-sulfur cluster assembly accessory protein
MTIQISKAASTEIKRMQTVRQKPDGKFRIGIESGGCESWYYTIDLTDTIAENEQVYEVSGISVAVNIQHLQFLQGLKLDYSEDLMGGGFRFHNPQASKVCGCGNSFTIHP